jgi:hypothetical protein
MSFPLPPHCLFQVAILLLRLLNLLVDLLATLGAVPVLQEHGARIRNDLELSAHDRKTSLDESVLVRRALILLLPCAGDVVVRREGVLLENVGVLLDNGHVGLELGQAGVAELIGAREVRVCDRIRSLQVGVERCDEAAVCVGGEVEGAGADVGVLDGFDCVVYYGV